MVIVALGHLAGNLERRAGPYERAGLLDNPALEVGVVGIGRGAVIATDLDARTVSVIFVSLPTRAADQVGDFQNTVVQPLACDGGVVRDDGVDVEEIAVGRVPAVERVVGTPHGTSGEDVGRNRGAGLERGRALVLGLRVFGGVEVVGERDLRGRPLGVHLDVGVRHSGVCEIERLGACLIGIPTGKRALDAVGMGVGRHVATIRGKRSRVLDALGLGLAVHVVVDEAVGLQLVGDVDGVGVIYFLAINDVALVCPKRWRRRVAAALRRRYLVELVAFILFVHGERAARGGHLVCQHERAVGPLVVIEDSAAGFLAAAVEVARRNHLVRGYVASVVGISSGLEVVAGQKDAPGAGEARIVVGRVPKVRVFPVSLFEWRTVQAFMDGEQFHIGVPLGHCHLIEVDLAHHAVVVHVHDGGTVAGDRDVSLRVCGVVRETRVVLELVHLSRRIAQGPDLRRLNKVVCLGGVCSIHVVSHALLPIVHRVGNLDRRPMGDEIRACNGLSRVAVINLPTGSIEPTGKRVPGTGRRRKLDALAVLAHLDKHVVACGATCSVERNPCARHHDGEDVHMVGPLGHGNRVHALACGVLPARKLMHGVDVERDARDVHGIVVVCNHGSNDLRGTVVHGVVEIDVEHVGIAGVHVIRCRLGHAYGHAEANGNVVQEPAEKRLAGGLRRLRLHERLAVLDDLRAYDCIAVMEHIRRQLCHGLVRDHVDREVLHHHALEVGAGLGGGNLLHGGGVVGHAVDAHLLASVHAGVEEAHMHGVVGLDDVALRVEQRDIDGHGILDRAALALNDLRHGVDDVLPAHGHGLHTGSLRQHALAGSHLDGDAASLRVAGERRIGRLLGIVGRGRDSDVGAGLAVCGLGSRVGGIGSVLIGGLLAVGYTRLGRGLVGKLTTCGTRFGSRLVCRRLAGLRRLVASATLIALLGLAGLRTLLRLDAGTALVATLLGLRTLGTLVTGNTLVTSVILPRLPLGRTLSGSVVSISRQRRPRLACRLRALVAHALKLALAHSHRSAIRLFTCWRNGVVGHHGLGGHDIPVCIPVRRPFGDLGGNDHPLVGLNCGDGHHRHLRPRHNNCHEHGKRPAWPGSGVHQSSHRFHAHTLLPSIETPAPDSKADRCVRGAFPTAPAVPSRCLAPLFAENLTHGYA